MGSVVIGQRRPHVGRQEHGAVARDEHRELGMTAARRVVPMSMEAATGALHALAASGGTWSDGQDRYALDLRDGVHHHDAGPSRGDWTWAGVHGLLRGVRPLRRPVPVEVTVEEWSDDAVELGLRPSARVGDRFHDAATEVLETVAGALLLAGDGVTAPAPAPERARGRHALVINRCWRPMVAPVG